MAIGVWGVQVLMNTSWFVRVPGLMAIGVRGVQISISTSCSVTCPGVHGHMRVRCPGINEHILVCEVSRR